MTTKTEPLRITPGDKTICMLRSSINKWDIYKCFRDSDGWFWQARKENRQKDFAKWYQCVSWASTNN